MSSEALVEKNQAREFNRMLQTFYVERASTDTLLNDGTALSMGAIEARVEPAEEGYRIKVFPGAEAMRIEVGDRVTLTLDGPISLETTVDSVKMVDAPEHIQEVDPELIVPLFFNYVKNALVSQRRPGIINVDEKAGERLVDDVMAHTQEFMCAIGGFETIQKNNNRIEDIWRLVDRYLVDEHIENQLEPTRGGDFLATVFLDSIWHELGAKDFVETIGMIEREYLDDGSSVTQISLHKPDGFLLRFGDDEALDSTELHSDLNIMIEPKKIMVQNYSGNFEDLPEQYHEALYEFLRRAEVPELDYPQE